MTAQTSSVPIIDLAALRGGGEAGLRAVAAEIRHAAEEVGFFYVAGHGVDPALQRRAQETAQAFFARPEAEKRRVAVDQRNRGFLALDHENPIALITRQQFRQAIQNAGHIAQLPRPAAIAVGASLTKVFGFVSHDLE